MSIILDTDSLSITQVGSGMLYERLARRLSECDPSEIHTTIVSFQEQMQGRLAALNRARSDDELLKHYRRLAETFDEFRQMRIFLFDRVALDRFKDLQRQRIRIGTQDLRIASIALNTNSLLLSRNLRDFRKVPGLRVEDWTA